MNASELKNKVEVYHKVSFKNELLENDTRYELLKPNLWVQIMPTLSGKNGMNEVTEYAETTHKIRCRKQSLNPSIDMYFKLDDLRFDILYFQPDFKNNEYWEIMLKVKYE